MGLQAIIDRIRRRYFVISLFLIIQREICSLILIVHILRRVNLSLGLRIDGGITAVIMFFLELDSDREFLGHNSNVFLRVKNSLFR